MGKHRAGGATSTITFPKTAKAAESFSSLKLMSHLETCHLQHKKKELCVKLQNMILLKLQMLAS